MDILASYHRNLQTEEDTGGVITSWTVIWVTLAVSALQGAVCYLFFVSKSRKDGRLYSSSSAADTTDSCLNLYEPRQHLLSTNSTAPTTTTTVLPPSFGKAWYAEAWNVNDKDTLQCTGLDAFMFLRLLRLGARISALGSVLSLVLIPVYASDEASGNATLQFNRLTLARVVVASSSATTTWRLYVSVAAQWIFVAVVLYEFWNEWVLYVENRTKFLTQNSGSGSSSRYFAVRVEKVPIENNSKSTVRRYFEHLFPGKVREATVCLDTQDLEALMAKRQGVIESLEGVVANLHAKPHQQRPQIRATKLCGGPKVDAIEHYMTEIDALNFQIDALRATILPSSVDDDDDDDEDYGPEQSPDLEDSRESNEDSLEVDLYLDTTSSRFLLGDESSAASTTNGDDDDDDDKEVSTSTSINKKKNDSSSRATTTAFVTFSSLRAQQTAIQCELSGNPDSMVVTGAVAADPNVTLWQNVTVPWSRHLLLKRCAAVFFTVGVLFWAVPVSFVTAIANLNSIFAATSWTPDPVDPNQHYWYGLVAGLLPVIALAVLMAVLYLTIAAVATSLVRHKSKPEVDGYVLFWHQLFQFANLWLILIGGSAFNQIDALIKNPGSIVTVLAEALPGAATFFVNIITVSTLGALGMELSMLPKYAVNAIMNCIHSEASRTQRQLDNAKKPPSIVWGKQIPPVIFIFLATFLYTAIVPIMELFGLVYFTGSYIVYKHQCLHVYAQEFDGGGDATWQQVFGFLMACLYMGQLVFIAYMGLKEAPIHAGLGAVPLIATIFVHLALKRKLIVPSRNLSLEIAANVDYQCDDSELVSKSDYNCATTAPIYLQPALNKEKEEREPMPYRRRSGIVPSSPPSDCSV